MVLEEPFLFISVIILQQHLPHIAPTTCTLPQNSCKCIHFIQMYWCPFGE